MEAMYDTANYEGMKPEEVVYPNIIQAVSM